MMSTHTHIYVREPLRASPSLFQSLAHNSLSARRRTGRLPTRHRRPFDSRAATTCEKSLIPARAPSAPTPWPPRLTRTEGNPWAQVTHTHTLVAARGAHYRPWLAADLPFPPTIMPICNQILSTSPFIIFENYFYNDTLIKIHKFER